MVMTNHVVHFETSDVSTSLNHSRNGMAQNCGITATKDSWLMASLRYVRIIMFMTGIMLLASSSGRKLSSKELTVKKLRRNNQQVRLERREAHSLQ